MPKKRHSAEQIVAKLRQIDVLVAQGRTIGQACKDAGIAEHQHKSPHQVVQIRFLHHSSFTARGR